MKRSPGGELAAAVPGLNPQQQRVTEHVTGPVLVIAGAGTGKTRVMAHRAAAVLRHGVAAPRLLLLTFTRRAAEELRSRVTSVLGEQGTALPWCGTFHATAARLLRLYGRAIDVPAEFTILDDDDSRALMGSIVNELFDPEERRHLPVKGTLARVYSFMVNTESELAPALAATGNGAAAASAEQIERIFAVYRERKRAASALDYDDLLLRWLDLLRSPAVNCAGLFDHIMVDEYQDTNVLQERILVELCRGHRNLMVVGDDAQAIYGFRGATVKNILRFESRFPEAARLTLEQNYRSTQAILDAANTMIGEADIGFDKNLFTVLGPGERPVLRVCADDREQADAVAEAVVQAWRHGGVPLREQAVLFRSSFHSFKLELTLQRLGIPFRKFGGPRFADSAHVKDALAFVRLRENRRDETAWRRVLALFPGVGDATATRLFQAVAAAADPAAAFRGVSLPKRAEPLRDSFAGLLAALFGGDAALVAEIGAILEFYLPLLTDLYDEAEARKANLKELHTLALKYPDRRSFLDDLLVGDDSVLARDCEGRQEYLTLSTVHSAKGCEWDCVYVIQLVEGGLPSGPSQDNPEQIEEERRLLYVAMTRARRRLMLLYPQARETIEGGRRNLVRCYVSRFLSAGVIASCDLAGRDGESDPDAPYYEYDDQPRRSPGGLSGPPRRPRRFTWE